MHVLFLITVMPQKLVIQTQQCVEFDAVQSTAVLSCVSSSERQHLLPHTC